MIPGIQELVSSVGVEKESGQAGGNSSQVSLSHKKLNREVTFSI